MPNTSNSEQSESNNQVASEAAPSYKYLISRKIDIQVNLPNSIYLHGSVPLFSSQMSISEYKNMTVSPEISIIAYPKLLVETMISVPPNGTIYAYSEMNMDGATVYTSDAVRCIINKFGLSDTVKSLAADDGYSIDDVVLLPHEFSNKELLPQVFFVIEENGPIATVCALTNISDRWLQIPTDYPIGSYVIMVQ